MTLSSSTAAAVHVGVAPPTDDCRWSYGQFPSDRLRGFHPESVCAGLHPARMKIQVQSPEQAFNQSQEMFRNLTGRQSPDILFIASCMWCVDPQT